MTRGILNVLDPVFFVYMWILAFIDPIFEQPKMTFFTSEDDVLDAIYAGKEIKGTGDRLVQISDHAVAKVSYEPFVDQEVLAMQLVEYQTRVPSPRTLRIVACESQTGYWLVMDQVKNGRSLKDAWPTMSFFGKLKVVLALRSYLRQFMRIKPSIYRGRPGPVSPKPYAICKGTQFQVPGVRGPSASPTIACLQGYFDSVYKGIRPFRDIQPLASSVFRSLVFTHNDIHMSNLLIDDRGIVWIVDYTSAGYYPPSFEHVAMAETSRLHGDPEDWQSWIRYMIPQPAPEVVAWFRAINSDTP